MTAIICGMGRSAYEVSDTHSYDEVDHVVMVMESRPAVSRLWPLAPMRRHKICLVTAGRMPGQDAFGAIQEVVQILESDPATDWSRVNIDALRKHLIDMNEVTLHATATSRMLDDGVEIAVTGEGRTLEAIKRMIPAHVAELGKIGWNAKTTDLPNGVTLTVKTGDPEQLTKLKALGFMGIMVQGGHHQPHHLMIARGDLHVH